jgi:phosphoribosylformylglycinamidine synthase
MKPGHLLVMLGSMQGWLDQSLYARELFGEEQGAPPPVDLAAERRCGDFVRKLIEDGLVLTCHDISDGGLACAAAEMALQSDIGIGLGYRGDLADEAFLFGEDQARYLIAVPESELAGIEGLAQAARVESLVVGEVGGRAISFLGASGTNVRLSLDVLRQAHESWLPSYMKT